MASLQVWPGLSETFRVGLADAAEALGEWSGHSSLNEASIIVLQTGLSETQGLHGARLIEKPK